MDDRCQQWPEAKGCHRKKESRDRAKEIEREISNVERMIDNGAQGHHRSIPYHDDDRDPGHRSFGPAAPPRSINESNQQDGGKYRDAHLRNYPR